MIYFPQQPQTAAGFFFFFCYGCLIWWSLCWDNVMSQVNKHIMAFLMAISPQQDTISQEVLWLYPPPPLVECVEEDPWGFVNGTEQLRCWWEGVDTGQNGLWQPQELKWGVQGWLDELEWCAEEGRVGRGVCARARASKQPVIGLLGRVLRAAESCSCQE